MASDPNAPIANLKTSKDQMQYLLEATLRIERSLTNLTQTQASFERIIETKFHNLDVKMTEIQTTVEQLQGDVNAVKLARSNDSGDDRPTTERFQTVPRAARTAAVPVVDPRTTVFAPDVTATVPPQVFTPPAPQTSVEAFADALLSTPSTHTGAASQRSPSGAAEDCA